MCNQCDKVYRDRSSLEIHLDRVHEEFPKNDTKYDCTKCGKIYLCKTKLKRHIEVKHEGKRQNCEFCEKTFETTKGLELHFEKVHRRKNNE